MSFLDTLTQWKDAVSEVELDQIDWENPGSWPLAVKIFLLVVAFLFTLGIGYSLITKTQLDDLGVVQKREQDLRAEFEAKAFEAANLEELRQQMQEMETTFGALVSQLPSDTEVTGLLEDITAIGLDQSGRLLISTINNYILPTTTGTISGNSDDVLVLNS